MKKMIHSLFTMIILLAGLASASFAVPAIPDTFYGTVTMDSSNVSAGSIITVTVNGVADSPYPITTDGYYELYVKKGSSGETIKFYINGKDFGTATRSGGSTTNYNLSYITPPPQENPPEPPPSGGGGGGGGGSSPPTSDDDDDESDNETHGDDSGENPQCIEKWSCSTWKKCEDNTQTRRCFDTKKCGTEENKPSESQPCTPEEKNKSNSTESPTGFALYDILKQPANQAGIAIIPAAFLIGLYARRNMQAKIRKK